MADGRPLNRAFPTLVVQRQLGMKERSTMGSGRMGSRDCRYEASIGWTSKACSISEKSPSAFSSLRRLCPPFVCASCERYSTSPTGLWLPRPAEVMDECRQLPVTGGETKCDRANLSQNCGGEAVVQQVTYLIPRFPCSLTLIRALENRDCRSYGRAQTDPASLLRIEWSVVGGG